jgi:hypothetical protein
VRVRVAQFIFCGGSCCSIYFFGGFMLLNLFFVGVRVAQFIFVGIRVAQFLLILGFCRSLFVFLSFFIWTVVLSVFL